MNNNGQRELYPFQKQSIIRLENQDGRALLALEMGLGKTIVALTALRRNPEWLPALVICPASVKYHWEHEAKHFANMRSSICEGQQPPKRGRSLMSRSTPLTIINYDIVRFWVPWIRQQKFKTIVLDECHYVASPKAKRTRATRAIAGRLRQVIALSGTPLVNRPSELWTTLNMIWPDEYDNFSEFANRYCQPKWTPWGWNYSGTSHLNELHKRLTTSGMIRYRKEDVLTSLPNKVRTIYPCAISDRTQYEEAKNNFIFWLRRHYAHKVSSAIRAQSLVKMGYLMRLVAKLKLRSATEWINQFLEETDEKLVLFAIHRRCIEALQRRVNAKSVTVDGSVTGRDRFAAVEQFQKNKQTRVFIGNLKAAGIGITLTAASTVAFLELGWRPGDHTQAEDRIHRIGQQKTAWINYLIAGDTIDEELCKRLQEKQKTISKVLDGSADNGGLNLHDDLIQILMGANA